MTASDQDTVHEVISEQCGLIWDATRMLQNIARLSPTASQMALIPVATTWEDLDPAGRRLFEAMLPGWVQPVADSVTFVHAMRNGGRDE